MLTRLPGSPTLRLTAGYAAVASALPYLGLKLLWLSGSTLGVADRSMMAERSMFVLNAITAGMDVAGIALALAFTHPWGLRIPAWLLLPPMWVATGLLATFVVGVPVAAILYALGSLPLITGGPVEGWVYVLVYIEFAGLGTGLMLAFSLYARARWAEVFQRQAIVRSSASHRVRVVLANATAPIAIALGVWYLSWAFGATLGLAQETVARRTIIGSVINAIDAVLMMAAAAGVLMLIRGIGDSLPRWLPLVMAWAGTGSMFGWGLWQTVNVVGQTALMQGAEARAAVNLLGLLRMIVGLVMGLLALFAIVEHQQHADIAPVQRQ